MDLLVMPQILVIIYVACIYRRIRNVRVIWCSWKRRLFPKVLYSFYNMAIACIYLLKKITQHTFYYFIYFIVVGSPENNLQYHLHFLQNLIIYNKAAIHIHSLTRFSIFSLDLNKTRKISWSFSSFQQPGFDEPVPTIASDSGSWLTCRIWCVCCCSSQLESMVIWVTVDFLSAQTILAIFFLQLISLLQYKPGISFWCHYQTK